jgi:flagellar hook assembly protein FlgD
MSRSFLLILALLACSTALMATFGNDLSLSIYPNPFETQTTLECYVPSASMVSVAIYSKPGLMVKEIYRGELEPGLYTFTWDGHDDNNVKLPGSTYSCELSAGERFTSVKKIIILK